MPMYWGDYLRDTRDLTTLQHGAYMLLIAHYWQHRSLPTNEKQLAAIAGLSVQKWRAICDPVAAKFSDGWTHKRIDRELEKSERQIIQRVIAGRRGGLKSGTTRSAMKGLRIKEAAASSPLKREVSGNEATGQAKTKHSRTNHNVNITSTEYVPRGDPVDKCGQLTKKRPSEEERKQATEKAIERIRSHKRGRS